MHTATPHNTTPQLLALTEPATEAMHDSGVDLSQWYVPKGYRVRSGAQLE